MESNDFGQLVKALREGQIYKRRPWSQKKLAGELSKHYAMVAGQKLEFTDKNIYDIEKGNKKQFDLDLLVSLANALELTTMERKEFFLATSGIHSQNVPEGKDDPYITYNDLMSVLNEIQTPAFVMDVYGDIVAANLSISMFLGVDESYIEQARNDHPIGYHLMNFICSDDSNYRSIVGEHWLNAVIYNMQFFRAVSLRYRASSHFQERFKALSERHPIFEGYWGKNLTEKHSNATNSEYYEYEHPGYGFVKYLGAVTTTSTRFGELFLTIYVPRSPDTSQVFTSIYQKIKEQIGEDELMYREFADWPKQ